MTFWLSNPRLLDCIAFLKCIQILKYVFWVTFCFCLWASGPAYTRPQQSQKAVNNTRLVNHSFLNFLGTFPPFFSKTCYHAYWFSFWLIKIDPTSTPGIICSSVIHILLVLSREVECHFHVIFFYVLSWVVEEPSACKLFACRAVVMHELLLHCQLHAKSVLPSLVAC